MDIFRWRILVCNEKRRIPGFQMEKYPRIPPVTKRKREMTTRILLYSDEPILAKGLESVLRQVDGFELLPTCNTVAGVADQVNHGMPDLVLLDLTPEITFAVLTDLKHAMSSTKIVLWVNSI